MKMLNLLVKNNRKKHLGRIFLIYDSIGTKRIENLFNLLSFGCNHQTLEYELRCLKFSPSRICKSPLINRLIYYRTVEDKSFGPNQMFKNIWSTSAY